MIGTNDTKIPIPIGVYKDNIRQIVLSARANGMTPVVATLPELKFSPYYQTNREYTQIYSDEIVKMSVEYDYEVCDMSDMGAYLVDGVHFDNEGYTKIALKMAEKILGMK